MKGKFTLKGETFHFEGMPLPESFNEKILKLITHNESPEKFFKFYERMMKNPSYRSVHQLWPFLNQKGIPLAPDGCFFAYKSVKSDFYDHHSGDFLNKPGTLNEMPRNKISDDPDVACHEGFHVGSREYARSFHTSNQIIVVCKVDPADVVCVPKDSSHGKMRVCRYLVVGLDNGQHMPEANLEEETLHTESPDEVAETRGATPRKSEFEEPEDETEEPEKGEEGQAVEKPKKKETKKPNLHKAEVKDKSAFKKYDNMNAKELMDCSIDELRQYAGKGLDIVGASKIPGGKTALVSKITKMRK